jgi:lipoate-protein ligase B
MIECVDLGLINYNEAWKVQEDLRLKRERGEISDRLLLLEHPPVFTLGKRDCDEDIVSARGLIAKDGIDIVKTNRGGRITYHGPGQLVGYFICSVNEIGVKRFVWLIEELLIGVLSGFGIEGNRDPEHPGIWVGKNKIAAIGLHVSRGITQHGFALNVNPDLNHYRHIIPCGIKARGVTSMEVLLGRSPSVEEVKKTLKVKVNS